MLVSDLKFVMEISLFTRLNTLKTCLVDGSLNGFPGAEGVTLPPVVNLSLKSWA